MFDFMDEAVYVHRKLPAADEKLAMAQYKIRFDILIAPFLKRSQSPALPHPHRDTKL